MKTKPIEQTVHRSAKTGRFVSPGYAAKHKATTQRETRRIRRRKH